MKASRRHFIRGLAATSVAMHHWPALASTDRKDLDSIRSVLDQYYEGRTVALEDVTLTAPALAENGLSVGARISVVPLDGRERRVTGIRLIAPANPEPVLIDFQWPDGMHHASAETRVRLADSQTLFAIAECDDGQLLGATQDVVVTLAACLDSFR